MSDLLDNSETMKEKRGKTLRVLAILSLVSLAMNALGLIFTLLSGPATTEEMEEQKVALLTIITPEILEIVGEDYLTDTIQILEVSNDLFFSLNGINACILLLGAYGVYLMYALRKQGYYFYLIYSFAPIVVSLAFFGTGFYIVLGAIFTAIVAVVFCILYGFQLKRMS